MLVGGNQFELNEQTMVAALQYYFDSVVFRDGNSPIVAKIGPAAYTNGVNVSFRVDVKQRTDDTP